jgi:hypothetical protein
MAWLLLTAALVAVVGSLSLVPSATHNSTLQAYGQGPVPGCNTPETQALPFCDTSLPLEDRVNNLISLLMPEEKVLVAWSIDSFCHSEQPFLMEARQSPDANISRLGLAHSLPSSLSSR